MNQLMQQIHAFWLLALAVVVSPFMFAANFLKSVLLSATQRFKRMVYRAVALFAFFVFGLSSAHADVLWSK